MLTWEESTALVSYQIIRRHGAVVPFESNKIAHAMMKSFNAVNGVLAFAQSISGGWLQGLWRPLKPSQLSAHAADRAAGLDRPPHVAPQQGQSRLQRFFCSSKPDMRNAP